jgi:ABC-2 type transport system ATP-binding protein
LRPVDARRLRQRRDPRVSYGVIDGLTGPAGGNWAAPIRSYARCAGGNPAWGAVGDKPAVAVEDRGPGALVSEIRAPTLIMQGTVDTLFPLSEAIANYQQLRANHGR